MKILHRWTDKVLFEGEFENTRDMVLAAIEAGVDLKFATFRTLDGATWDLQGIDWKGKDIENIDFRYVKAHNNNFDNCNLERANLCKGDFTGSSFKNCKFKDTMLTPSIVDGCDFTGTNLEEAKTEFTDFSKAKGVDL